MIHALALVAAHLNGDAKPDLVTVNFDDSAFISVILNRTPDPSFDCNLNTVLDQCDLRDEVSADVDMDEVPDDCEPDCNGNDIPDDWEIVTGDARDCNGNWIPDFCDVAGGFSQDENANNVPDECDPRVFLRGDCNDDGEVDISDATCVLEWRFSGSPARGCVAATNTNGDGAINIADAIYILSSLFLGGPSPAAPFPGCGPGTLKMDIELGALVGSQQIPRSHARWC